MKVQIKDKMLDQKSEEICQMLATGVDGLFKKRAMALLAIDDGKTRAEAAETSGLNIGQVHYLVRLYRQKGIAIFPDSMTDQQKSEKESKKHVKKEADKKKKEKKSLKDKKQKKGKKKDKKKQDKKKKENKKKKSGKKKESKK